MQSPRPSIVFVHGIWANGSSFGKVIPALQAEGHEVMCAQHSLDSLEGDVATVVRTLGRVRSPVVLVGHSYGGTIITAAGTDDRVAGWSTSQRSRRTAASRRTANRISSRSRSARP
jgi:pimeloyl-ACP methyl ester carboxylesterase